MIEQRKNKQKLGLLQLPAHRQHSNYSNAIYPPRHNGMMAAATNPNLANGNEATNS